MFIHTTLCVCMCVCVCRQAVVLLKILCSGFPTSWKHVALSAWMRSYLISDTLFLMFVECD